MIPILAWRPFGLLFALFFALAVTISASSPVALAKPSPGWCERLLADTAPGSFRERALGVLGIAPPASSEVERNQRLARWREFGQLPRGSEKIHSFLKDLARDFRQKRSWLSLKPSMNEVLELNRLVIKYADQFHGRPDMRGDFHLVLSRLFEYAERACSAPEDYEAFFSMQSYSRVEYNDIRHKAMRQIIERSSSRYDLARIFAKINAYELLNNLNLFDLQEKDRLNLGSEIVDQAKSIDLLSSLIGLRLDPKSPEMKDLRKRYIRRFPDQYLRSYSFHQDIRELTVEEIQKLPSQLSIGSRTIEIAWDRVRRRETGMRILEIISSEEKLPADSIALILRLAGLEESGLRANIDSFSQSDVGDFYEIVLELHESIRALRKHRMPLFHGIALNLSGLKKSEFNKFVSVLSLARDVFNLGDKQPSDWQRIAQDIFRGNQDQQLERARNSLTREIQMLFGEHKLDITFADLERLKSQWGNLEPIYTLLSRYRGKSHWHPELKVLGRIFKHSLRGDFKHYKYEGDPEDSEDMAKARQQLSMLDTNARKQAWLKPRFRAAAVEAAVASSAPTSGRAEIIRDQLRYTVLAHLPKDLDIEPIPGVRETWWEDAINFPASKFQDYLSEVARTARSEGGPALSKAQLFKLFYPRLIQRLAANESEEEMKWLVGVLLGLSGSFPLDAQNVTDLKGLRDLLRSETRGDGGRAIIFSTTFDDPKILLMVGDLVQAISCQNYRTGGYIQTLPGYVIDADTKGFASFALNPAHFGSPEDFNAIFESLKSEAPPTVDLDGNLHVARFTLADRRQIISRPLGRAYLRRMIKLGWAGNSPGLGYETPYAQAHHYFPIMKQQSIEILQEMAQEMGARLNAKVRMTGTRNDLGIYSDLGGGIQGGGYTVNFGLRDEK